MRYVFLVFPFEASRISATMSRLPRCLLLRLLSFFGVKFINSPSKRAESSPFSIIDRKGCADLNVLKTSEGYLEKIENRNKFFIFLKFAEFFKGFFYFGVFFEEYAYPVFVCCHG